MKPRRAKPDTIKTNPILTRSVGSVPSTIGIAAFIASSWWLRESLANQKWIGGQKSKVCSQRSVALRGCNKRLFLTEHLQNHRIVGTDWFAILPPYIEFELASPSPVQPARSASPEARTSGARPIAAKLPSPETDRGPFLLDGIRGEYRHLSQGPVPGCHARRACVDGLKGCSWQYQDLSETARSGSIHRRHRARSVATTSRQ